MMTASTIDLLLSRRFGPLFVVQFLGAFNDNLLKSALGVLATYRLAQRAGLDAGALAMLAGALFIAPFVLFSGAAGTLADRIDKSRIARAVKLAEIAIMTVGAAGLVAGSLTTLLGALFLLGVHSTVFGPVKYALLPHHLADAELVAGNALVDAGTFLAILLGTLCGSALVLAPDGPALVGAIGIGAAIAGWIAARALPPAAPPAPETVPRPRLLADSVAVIRHAATDHGLLRPILALSWFWALGGAIVSGLPVLARDTLGTGESAVTVMLAIFALGVGAGSMLANRLLGTTVTARPVPWAALAMAGCALVVAAGAGEVPASPTPLAQTLERPAAWRFLGGLAGLAIAGGLFAVPLYAMLLRRSDAAHRARVIAANNILNAVAMVVVALLAATLLASGWTMPGIIGLCGLVTIAIAGACTRLGAVPPPR